MSLPTTSLASSISSATGLCIEDPEVEKANLALVFDKYTKSASSLPNEKGWLGETLYMYQGHWYSLTKIVSVETVMASHDMFQANPTDIYLVTPPKSGTTWIKALAFAIANRTRYKNTPTHPLLMFNPHDCLPFIENEMLRRKPTYSNPNYTRLFSTHMSYTSLPHSIISHRCRLVYMCRNPKDVLVSAFHFWKRLKHTSLNQTTFEEAFQMFSKGLTPTGPYWDHVKGYYKASVEHPTYVLFLTYENMKMDTTNNVKRLANFMGYPFTAEEEAKGAVQDIVSLCSFESLRKVNQNGDTLVGAPSNAFFREGKVGDWTKHLTKEMSEILDEITKEKFHGLDISF